MNKITLTCEIITPMFAGSAIPEICELRPPAIKGALRFWWRALNGHKDMDAMRQEEAELFGSPDEKLGRSKVQISINTVGLKPEQISLENEKPILKYLGFGLQETIDRYCFQPKQSFKLSIAFDNEHALEEIKSAFRALMLYGGLGGRNRNGWGKIWIPDLLPIQKAIDTSTPLPKYAAFHAGSKCFKSKKTTFNWREALEEIGGHYKDFRSNLDRKKSYSKRLLVAQPIIDPQKTSPENIGFLDRHAKCLFLSVLPEGNKFRGQILVLPYDYLHGIEKSSLETKPQPSEISKYSIDYKDVHDKMLEHFSKCMNPMTQIPL